MSSTSCRKNDAVSGVTCIPRSSGKSGVALARKASPSRQSAQLYGSRILEPAITPMQTKTSSTAEALAKDENFPWGSRENTNARTKGNAGGSIIFPVGQEKENR